MRLDLDARYELRLPADLKRVFIECTAANDLDASQVLRSMIRDYVKLHAQSDLLTSKPARRKDSKAK